MEEITTRLARQMLDSQTQTQRLCDQIAARLEKLEQKPPGLAPGMNDTHILSLKVRRRAALHHEEPDPYQLKEWDAKDIGLFYPDMPASYGPGNPTVYCGGRYFREVTGFARNIRDYIRRHPASPVYSKLETLLLGDAYEWFTQTLSDEVRDDFFHTPDGVEQFLLALEAKFRMNPLRAQQHLAAITFGPQQVRDNRTSDRYVSEIRNALTAAGIAVTEEAVVQRAWLQLDPVYRDRVPPPMAHQVEAQEEQKEPSNLDSEPSPPESTAYTAVGPPSENQAWFEAMLEKIAQRVEAAIAVSSRNTATWQQNAGPRQPGYAPAAEPGRLESCVLDCEYRDPEAAEPTRVNCRVADYAAFITGFEGTRALALVVADTGCNTTLVAEGFVRKYQPNAERTATPPLTVNGIASSLESKEVALLVLLVPSKLRGANVTCRVRVRARVVPALAATLLMGTDNMIPERMLVDLDTRQLVFKGHK
ncbi:hypothetical protein KEM54_002970 [Ascosphaera aggregata]|nr:hypothetical protein KEM54_002970 [Ascosphaera aggregata]